MIAKAHKAGKGRNRKVPRALLPMEASHRHRWGEPSSLIASLASGGDASVHNVARRLQHLREQLEGSTSDMEARALVQEALWLFRREGPVYWSAWGLNEDVAMLPRLTQGRMACATTDWCAARNGNSRHLKYRKIGSEEVLPLLASTTSHHHAS